MSVDSRPWPPRYAFEEHQASHDELRGLVAQADRLLADAEVTLVSTASRHALAHNAVVILAHLALAAHGWRTTESHHYWGIGSLKHTVGLSDDEVDVLQAHRTKRHHATYSPEPMVSETEMAELLAQAKDLRVRVVGWLCDQHADLWDTTPD